MSTCTVTLTQAAPAGGSSVTLASNNAGAHRPGFGHGSGGIDHRHLLGHRRRRHCQRSERNRHRLDNGSSANARVGLSARSGYLRGLQSREPRTERGEHLHGHVDRAAPAGGASVTLTNTNTVLTVPASVTVAAGATVAHSAPPLSIASDQSATVTATYNGSSANATVGLSASSGYLRWPATRQFGTERFRHLHGYLNQGGASGWCHRHADQHQHGADSASLGNGSGGCDICDIQRHDTEASPAIRAQPSPPRTTAVLRTRASGLSASVRVSSLACTRHLGTERFRHLHGYLNQGGASGWCARHADQHQHGADSASLGHGSGGCDIRDIQRHDTGYCQRSERHPHRYLQRQFCERDRRAVGVCTGIFTGLQPATSGPNASGTCTVTLTKAAPAGGALVTVTNTNTVLTVPASVTVAAGATFVTFNATTLGIASDQSATLTATYNGSSANATVGLSASVQVSSLACTRQSGTERFRHLHGNLNQGGAGGWCARHADQHQHGADSASLGNGGGGCDCGHSTPRHWACQRSERHPHRHLQRLR